MVGNYQGVVRELLVHDLEESDAERPAALLEPGDGRGGDPLFLIVLLLVGVGEGLLAVVTAVVVVVTAAAAWTPRVLLLLLLFLVIVGVVVAGALPEQLEELGAGLVALAVDGVVLLGARELLLLRLVLAALALGPRLELAGVRGGG